MSQRHFIVPRADAGRALGDWLRGRLSLSARAARGLLQQRRVRLEGVVCRDGARRLRPGQRIVVEVLDRASAPPDSPRPSPALPASVLRHVDAHVVVVDKPPGLTTMRHPEDIASFGKRARKYLPSTLADLLPSLLPPSRRGRPSPVRAVHRLDKDTSGLVVFARTVEAESHLGRQLRAHSFERLYLALVRGRPQAGRIESWLVADRGDGRRGSSGRPGHGQRAITHVRIVEELGDYTLVECRLETGRTHQIRIHLGEAGAPLCGERIYDRPVHGSPLPDGSGARRVALHAATLGFEHPATGKRMHFTVPLPADLAGLLERLRRACGKG